MLRLFSPAKINLFLRVLGKRPDGYHELASLFQAVDLGDTLTFEPSDRAEFSCSDSTLPLDNSNLVLRAVELFQKKTGIQTPVKIRLDKNIPVQAGLGGGSGNAATTLWALNQLSGGIVSEDLLKQWSMEIGSDIPFFFSTGTAYCTGRGEHVRSLNRISSNLDFPASCLIVKPKIGLSTPEVYRRLGLPTGSFDSFTPLTEIQSFTINPGHCINDLERSAFSICPALKELKSKLLHSGYPIVSMSGSGSAFFCLGNGEPPVFKGSDVSIYTARFLNRNLKDWYHEPEHGTVYTKSDK